MTNTKAQHESSQVQDLFYDGDILLDRCRYKWNKTECAYFGNGGSCGTYGAALHNGKWIPAWMPADSCDVEWSDESFDDPESAIERSHSYFS